MSESPRDDSGLAKQLRDLLKGIREAAPLLESNRAQFDQDVERVAQGLIRLTGAHGEVELNVSTNRIMVDEDEVYKSESRTDNLAFDLFRQGLRRISFKPGLQQDEVLSFVTRFSECRQADQIDEDFVTSLWQDSLPNISFIALDNFTEKIFMSEADFVRRFRSVIDDVAPGLFELDEADEQVDKRSYDTLVDLQGIDRADLEQRKARKALESSEGGLRELLFSEGDLGAANAHLVHLIAAELLRQHSVFSASELQGVTVRILSAYLEAGEWQAFADAIRALQPIFDVGARLPHSMAERIERVERVVLGRDLAEQIAENLAPENTDFTAWARWLYVDREGLSAPSLLELINTCANPAGKDWLKDLLRRQSTASLDPWVDRLRDPNPGIVIEVIDVIVDSELGPQAQPLFMEALGHESPDVRHRALQALDAQYGPEIREVLLPLLKDPDERVRRLVVKKFVAAEDRSVATYLANTIKSGEIFAAGEDEQREIFEGVAHLSGERYLPLFEEKLNLEEQGVLSKLFGAGQDKITDTPTRRAVLSGLATMNSTDALALLNRVHQRAELSLAAHCDVALRIAQRTTHKPAEIAPVSSLRTEDISVGATRMGEASLFSPQMVNLAGVLASLGRPVEEKPDAHTGVESSVVDAPSPAPLSTENLVDLGPRPLLNHHVVFETWDRVRLSGTPTAVSSERFQLADLEVSLVGVDSATAERDVLKSVPPARIIERASARVRDERRRVKAANQVDNLLQGYLEESTSTFADASSPPNEVESDQSVDHLLQSYMETETIEDQALDDLLRSYIDVPQPTAPSGASEVASDKSETTPRRGGVYIAPEVRVDSEQRSEGGVAPESAVIDGETKDSSVATPAQSADNLDDMLRSYLEPESEN